MQAPLTIRAGKSRPLPRVTARKAGVTDTYTNSFHGDTRTLLVLLEQVGGKKYERCPLASLACGEDHSQPLVTADLEA